jgi:hypothetical protein
VGTVEVMVKYSKLAILVLFASASLLSACRDYHTEKEVRAKIDATIPKGTPKADVIKFLHDNSFKVIDDGMNVPSPPGCKDCIWVPASLETWSVWGECYIVADFSFDAKEERLLDYRVKTIFPAWK